MDVWAAPEQFLLDENYNPKVVAGCPPDFFSADGQLWGNPIYNWDLMKSQGFTWWISRVGSAFQLYDILRIDHFRGFDEYWSVPYGDRDARGGHWEKGPGYELFEVMEEELGRPQVIAEDLGILTDSVRELLRRTGYPGMKVLQFAFDSDQSDYLPQNYTDNCVVYTGTHDNRTTLGWLNDRSYDQRVRFERNVPAYRGASDLNRLIRFALDSRAEYCIIPMQDYLGLDDVARINTPGTIGDNWKWRLTQSYDKAATKKHIAKLTAASGRNQ